ncbi:uncharacterized protein LOC113332339 [Papaver somniferum]|uniref:uncharacterized protein LOC113332339 n=1 Tax=Papaver somniferum TaxID=3469 RepID=UPI000E6FD406|nr:uncharacterized protein LOC113332339 [Papaver somniferum]
MINVMFSDNPRKPEFLSTFLYGSVYHEEKMEQLKYIGEIGSRANLPWVIIGDLNITMHAHERSTFSTPTNVGYPEIQSIIDTADISDLGYIGNKFTWNNRPSGNDCIYARLDRALDNDHWLTHYGSSFVRHIDTIGSDHIPIILETNPMSSQDVRGSSPFRLINKLRFVKHDLKHWNIHHFGNIDHKWVNDRVNLETLLVNNFSSIGTTSNPYRNTEILNCIDPCISDIDNLSLLRPVTKQEIINTINQMTPWTSPGPDGFPPGFYKENIGLLIDDVWQTVNSFFESKHLLKEMNHTFLSFIPKIDNPSSPSNFRPISLCNTNYKIISKIIANRMKLFLSKMISPYHAAYVPNRNIQDNVIIAHELVHTMKRKTKKDKWGVMGLKLDMCKAFDRVEYCFLRDILKAFGFSEHWYLIHAEENNLIHDIKVSRLPPSINHLLFADDCLIFAKASHTEANNLLGLIKDFCMASGQVINLQKSGCFFSNNVHPDHVVSIINDLKVKKIALNEKHLGLPLFITSSRTDSFNYLNDHFDKMVAKWKAWKLIHNPNALWVAILRCKYFNNCHPLHYSKKDDCSWAWRNTCRGLDFILKHSIWEVKDGKSISAFRDRWIYNSCEPMLVANPSPNLTVSDFINDDTKSWNSELVRSFFTPNNAKNILDSRIPISGSDRLIWPHSKNDPFNVKSAYKVISGQIEYM